MAGTGEGVLELFNNRCWSGRSNNKKARKRAKGEERRGAPAAMVGPETWREWASANVGPEKRIQGLVILQRTGEIPATKHALKRNVWAQVGVHVRSSELLVSHQKAESS